MNFGKFSGVESSNDRKAGGGSKTQDFSGLKYRKGMKKDKSGKELGIEGRFYVANALWDKLELEKVNGLKQFTDKETGETVIASVVDKEATILKMSARGAKTRHFKSTRLEAALTRIGVIDSNLMDMNQFINVTEVPEGANQEIGGTPVITVLALSKGETKAKTEFPKKKSKSTDTASATVADAAPKATPAPQVDQAAAPVAAAKTDW